MTNRNAFADRALFVVCASSLAVPLGIFAWFVVTTFTSALPGLSSPTTRSLVSAALLQSMQLVALALVVAFPLGFATAVHLEEYPPAGRFTSLVERSLALLASIPAILYGLVTVAFLSNFAGVRSPVATGGFCLAGLLFPTAVTQSRDALRSAPRLLREASFALGANRWRALVHIVLPMAMPRIIAGVLIATARGLGAAAPLVVIGTSFSSRPDAASPLAVQLFESLVATDATQRTTSAAAAFVLVGFVVTLQSVALVLSNRYDRKKRRFGLTDGGLA